MKMAHAWAYLELSFGSIGLGLAALLFGNARWCFFAQASCGVWEPLAGSIVAIFALLFVAAGTLRVRRRPQLAAACYMPMVILVVVFLGQVWHWW